MELPNYVENIDGTLYCFLENEIDKTSFEKQCDKCPLKNSCFSKKDIYKNVSGDWHSLNASGLYGDEFDKCVDKYIRKDLRGIAKIVGLALTYGGTAYTVSGNMKTTKEEAQEKIDNFFRKLTTLNVYMIGAKKRVLEIGRVYNLFGRYRNMSKWAFSSSWKDKSYAQRTALNHPIQSTSAEILKIIMIRVDDYIEANKLSLLYGLGFPQKFDLNKISYKNMILHELMSTHDEVDSLFNQDYIDSLLPIIYEIMQIKDVMAAFNIGFDLELDCEYDENFRSLVASNSYLNSKIYVINKLKQNQMIDGGSVEPNTVLIDFENLNPDILNQLLKTSTEGGEYDLAISSEEGIYIHEHKISLDSIKDIGIKYQLAHMN